MAEVLRLQLLIKDLQPGDVLIHSARDMQGLVIANQKTRCNAFDRSISVLTVDGSLKNYLFFDNEGCIVVERTKLVQCCIDGM